MRNAEVVTREELIERLMDFYKECRLQADIEDRIAEIEEEAMDHYRVNVMPEEIENEVGEVENEAIEEELRRLEALTNEELAEEYNQE